MRMRRAVRRPDSVHALAKTRTRSAHSPAVAIQEGTLEHVVARALVAAGTDLGVTLRQAFAISTIQRDRDLWKALVDLLRERLLRMRSPSPQPVAAACDTGADCSLAGRRKVGTTLFWWQRMFVWRPAGRRWRVAAMACCLLTAKTASACT